VARDCFFRSGSRCTHNNFCRRSAGPTGQSLGTQKYFGFCCAAYGLIERGSSRVSSCCATYGLIERGSSRVWARSRNCHGSPSSSPFSARRRPGPLPPAHHRKGIGDLARPEFGAETSCRQNSCDGRTSGLVRDRIHPRNGYPDGRKRKVDGQKRITITSSSRIISLDYYMPGCCGRAKKMFNLKRKECIGKGMVTLNTNYFYLCWTCCFHKCR
jgi:hypothetical protein